MVDAVSGGQARDIMSMGEVSDTSHEQMGGGHVVVDDNHVAFRGLPLIDEVMST